MTASNREASISKTLQYEGGYTNDPRDPGGATNWGITIFDARKHWKPDATPQDVKDMPKEVAVEIYRKKYWAVMACDDRDTGPDFVDFDYGVHSGVGRVAALRKRLDPLKLTPVDYVKQACAARSSFLHSLKTFAAFGKGWSRRVADAEATGVRMALGAAGKPVEPTLRKEAQKATTKSVAHTGGAVATTTTAAPAIVHHAAASGHHWVALALLGTGLAVLVAAFVWHAVHNSNRATAYNNALSKP